MRSEKLLITSEPGIWQMFNKYELNRKVVSYGKIALIQLINIY